MFDWIQLNRSNVDVPSCLTLYKKIVPQFFFQTLQTNFWPTGYVSNILCPISQNFSSVQKWRPFWIFKFSPEMKKYRIASVSSTFRDRGISSKFSTHGVYKQYSSTLANFPKCFCPNHFIFIFPLIYLVSFTISNSFLQFSINLHYLWSKTLFSWNFNINFVMTLSS